MAVIDQYIDIELFEKEAGRTAHDASFGTYIKTVRLADHQKGYAICSEDGTDLAIFATYEAAFFAARQFQLNPVWVH